MLMWVFWVLLPGHLIGNLLQVLEQNEDFYPMLEGKLSDLSVNRVKAATCRLLLATVPVNSRAIVRVLGDDDEMLERVCGFATDTDPGLRCYGTGLLSVGLRDRSVADTVVNNDTPVKLLKRARMYASKLEKERQQAVKYIQDHLRLAASRHKKTINTGGSGATKATTPQRSLKRKHSDTDCYDPNPAVTPDFSKRRRRNREFRRGRDRDAESRASRRGFQALGDAGAAVYSGLSRIYGEYLEIFAPALKEDIIGTIITFLHSKNPAVISHTMTLTSHFLAHKKFSFSLVEAGGVDLLFTVFKLQQAAGQVGLLDRSLSMCLHGFVSSSAVVERLVVLNLDNMLSAAFKLLSSPNDRARQNAVVFFSLTLSFKVILDYFEKHNGLYTILNIIRVGNHPKSAAQRQLAQDACLCLRQYVRMHMALVTHRLRRKLAQLNHPSNRQSNTAPVLTAATVASRIPARVPKITWSKAIDLDDKTHEQNMVFYEKYRFSASSGNSNNSCSNPRDSELVRDALRVFCNCVSPPHHEDCWQHPLKDIRQYTLTARSMRTKKDDQAEAAVQGANTADNCSNCCSKAKDDKMLRPVRKLARERNAIKVCVYLLRYKRSVQNADAIRLLATRALLGLSRDRHISQILEKMQVGQLLSDMIRSDPVLEENADIHVRFRESALDLISHVTHRASNVVINEATDPTVRKIEKANHLPDALQKLPINARWSANSEAASVSPSSKLDEIITHFLREQHRQCANPVTTVPPFKLLGKGSLHRCPDPPATSSNLSICSRLLRRSRTGYRVGSSAFSSYYADAGIDRYVFSRYRPYRTVGAHVGSFAWGGVSVARFFGPNQQEMLIGNHDGELRQFNINSDEVVEEWTCHSPSSAIVNLETNEATSMGLQSRLILTGAVALSELAVNEIALWDANDTSALVERWRFQGGLRPEFNHYGDRIVALDVRSNEEADGLGFTVKGAVVVDIATGDVLCDLKDAMRSNDYGAETNCCFSPCDGTILTDGMMWDARIPTRALYKFDKLSNFGCGFFHPNGNEGDYLERRKTKLKSWFRVLDARDYRDITTIDLGRPVFDLCLNTKSTLLSVEGRYLEAGDVDDDDSICRLYDIGRKRPAEDDSDAEDGQDESDTLDDDEYDDESSSGGDEMEEETDESDEETSESEEVDSSEEEDEDAESDDDAAAHILAIEEDSDEDGNGSILSTRDLGYLLELPDTTYYEVHGNTRATKTTRKKTTSQGLKRQRAVVTCCPGAAIYLSDSMATKPEVDVEALGDKPVLLKRKDFLGTEKAAQSHPNRTYYYRQPTDLQRVIDTSTSHLVREPKDVKVLLARGQALFKQANYEQTIRDLNEVVVLDSSNAAAFYTRGLAYSKLDNVELAIRDFSRTLQINPEHVNAAYARASCYNSQGDFVRAIDDYNFALLKDKKLKLQQKHQQELHRSATLSRQQLQRQKQQQESASNALLFTQRVKKTSTVPLAETDNNAEGLRQEEKAAESSVDSRVQSLSKLSVTSAPAKTLSATRTAVLPPPSPATVSVEQRHTTEPEGFQYRQECNFQAAADEYSRAIQLNPHHFKAYFNRGFVYDKMRRFDAAVEDYTQALKMDPHNAFALYNRGISLDRSGDYQGALADFTRAIELLPTNADFYHNRGFCHRKQGNFELAIADYSRAIEFNPDHFKSLYNRAYSYDKLGRYEDAVQDYTAALRVEPENANAYHNRGSTYDKMKDTTRAIADFDRAITLQPRSVSSYNSRGLCHDQLGRHEEALQNFAKALALDPRSAVFYHNRGYCLRNMGRFEEAVEDYSSALALEPRNVAAYNNRGYALRKLRRFKEAVADYTTALAIDPQNTRTLSNRAYSLAKMHHIEQAIADYTQVLTLDPQNSYSRHNRAILTAKMKGGDVDERDLK
ncbi:Tetratricopeptide repeat [Phytophthora cactorum]|nr:Tetratricopeptide repeat [Phytophthora cactorum]